MSASRLSKEERTVAAAVDVFTRYGYARTTMADIALKAGIYRHALYLLFPDKEAIFERVIRKLDDQKLGEINEALASINSLEDKLLRACLVWALHGVELAAEHPDAADLFDLRFPAVRQVYANFSRLVSGLIAKAAARSGLEATPEELARMLVYGMRGSRDAAADTDEMRRLVAVQVKTLMRAISSGATKTRHCRS